MRTIQIQGTDLRPSELCMGTGDMGAGLDRQASFALLDSFFESGGNFIDTAKVYSDWIPGERSRSEKMIGEWIRERKNRSNVILATKGAHFDLATPHILRVTPADIVSDINASLQHLQTDRIDLYWLHRDNPTLPVGEILDTLNAQAQAGKIRYYGCSNWRVERIEAARKHAAENGLQPFAAVQNMWSLARVNTSSMIDPSIVAMDDELWAHHNQTQLAAIPFSSQANGLFQKMAAASPDALPKSLRQTYINPDTERRGLRLTQLREQTGLTITQIVLGYLLSQPFPTIPIFSSRSLEQLADTLSAAGVRLSTDQLAFLLG